MIILGLLLILLAVGAAAIAMTAPAATARVIELTAVGVTLRATPLAMFLAGAVSVVLVVLGIALMSQGTRRKARTRKELRGLRKDQATATAATSTSTAQSSSSRDAGHDGTRMETTKTSGKDSNRSNDSELEPDRRPNPGTSS